MKTAWKFVAESNSIVKTFIYNDTTQSCLHP